MNQKERILIFNAMNWRNIIKEFLKISRIFSQCEKCNREIWNLKNATLIDREDLKTQNETENYKFIEETKLFTQKQMSHCINVTMRKKKVRKRNWQRKKEKEKT